MDNGVFSQPEIKSWPMAMLLSHLDFYKPNKNLIDLLVNLSNCTVAIKGGKDMLHEVQKHLTDFDVIFHQLKADHAM